MGISKPFLKIFREEQPKNRKRFCARQPEFKSKNQDRRGRKSVEFQPVSEYCRQLFNRFADENATVKPSKKNRGDPGGRGRSDGINPNFNVSKSRRFWFNAFPYFPQTQLTGRTDT